jgi:hypothetical protein
LKSILTLSAAAAHVLFFVESFAVLWLVRICELTLTYVSRVCLS